MSRLFWLLALVAVGLAGVPTLIGRTALRQQLLPLVRPGLPSGAAIGSAELGWLSPVVLRDVSIPDLQGRPLLHIAEIRSDRPLWELAANPTDIGRITVEQLELAVIARPDGDNLRDLLRQLEQSPPSHSRPRVRLEVHQGRLSLVDPHGAVMLACEEIEVLFDDLRPAAAPARASLTAVTTMPTRAGRLDAAAEWRPADGAQELIGPGSLQFELQRWPLDPALLWLRGPLHAAALAGHLSLEMDGQWSQLSTAGGEAQLTVRLPDVDAALQPDDASQPLQVLRTRDARCKLQARYDGAYDRLDLAESTVESEWLDGRLSGSVSDLRGAMNCDVSADMAVKLSLLHRLLPPEMRREVDMQGVETRRVRLLGALRPDKTSGPVAPARGVGLEADIVWQKLAAYGIQSDNGELRVDVADKRIVTTPTRVPVSDGRIAAVPTVHLDADGPRLEFAGGPVLENVAFTPELCRSWLRYLSPLMANATTVDGGFTLAVDPATVELNAWPRTELRGQLQIHSARVGPGPMTQQILGSIQQLRGIAERRPAAALDPAGQWLTIADQNVEFVIRDGRVEHRNLQLAAGPVTIESGGSVGLVDETLELLLTIRLPESWFANRPLLAGLKGEGLQIPIRGTLSQPQVESRPLLDFGRGIGLRAADGFLQRLQERREQR